MIRIFVLFTCSIAVAISCLFGCSEKPKHDIYEIETDLGDHLSIKVLVSSHHILMFKVRGEDYFGTAVIKDRTQFTIPDDPLKYLKTIGAYGNTHFYKLNNVIFYVNNNELIGSLNPSYNFYQYIDGLKFRDGEKDDRFIAVISDLMKAGIFESICQYGEILAYEGSDEMKLILQRYAEGDFTEEELSINENSEKTAEEMTEWAKELLEQYYAS